MELLLKVTAGFLLFVQTFHAALLRDPTRPPVRTIDSAWYRDPPRNKIGSQNHPTEWSPEYYQQTEETNVESSNDYASGVPSGSMAIFPEDENNLSDDGSTANETSDYVASQQPEDIVPTTEDLPNRVQVNKTDAEEMFQNGTVTTAPNVSTSVGVTSQTNASVSSSGADFHSNTSGQERNHTQETTAEPNTRLTDNTGMTQTTSMTASTSAAAPETTEASTASPSKTVFPSETSPITTTATPSTAEKANISDKGSGQGNSGERGLASDSQTKKRNGAWGAVLGTAVAVAFVGLVAYIILKKKHRKAFSHRKLVEEFPSDPVLRLDNSEPLDLNFGGGAYYNPGLQGDNIQMTKFPGRPKN